MTAKALVAEGCGMVKFPVCMTDGSTYTMVLVDCLFAPECSLNLISVGRLTDILGLQVLFGSGQTICWEHVKGKRPTNFLVLPRCRYLTAMSCNFILPTPSIPGPISLLTSDDVALVYSPVTFTPPPVDLSLWHCRLGHPGWETTRKVLHGTCVTGTPYTGDLSTTMCCTSCIVAHKPQAPFAHNALRHDCPGNLLHFNVSGAFR